MSKSKSYEIKLTLTFDEDNAPVGPEDVLAEIQEAACGYFISNITIDNKPIKLEQDSLQEAYSEEEDLDAN